MHIDVDTQLNMFMVNKLVTNKASNHMDVN